MKKAKSSQEDFVEGDKVKYLRAKTQNQKNYILSIVENDITFCFGPSGTGKSFVAAGITAEHLNYHKTSQIIVTRPLVCAGKNLGSVPGEIEDKRFNRLLCEDIIKFEPLELMRGANFHDSYMILDEAQNCTLDQIKMFITRIGENSKVIINGDIKQTDLKDGSGLKICIDKLDGIDGVGICEFTHSDIQRNSIIRSILMALEDEQDILYQRQKR